VGILNVTPDSFSDGGQYQNIDAAVNHALQMVEQGADIIDVGGESTRPGSQRIQADEQIKRVLPVIQALKRKIPEKVLISIDTTLTETAIAALDAGASIINDISAGRDDPGIFQLAAQKQCSYILMHMQGSPGNMQDNPVYGDVVEEIRSFLIERAQVATNEGIKKENIIIDPGIGFGKTKEHNLQLMASLHRFVDTGFPVLLGTSRKRFMGSICAGVTPDQLIGATCATTALGVAAGVKIFRVHDVRENRQAADMAWTILNNSK
jgi:dihydropteroate synthase